MIWKTRVRYLAKGGAEQNAQAQQQFYTQLTGNYNQMFSKFNSVYDSLQSQLKPILDKGIDQNGFSAGQEAALRTDATNQTASSFAGQNKALQDKLAADNGGEAIPSGASAELRAQLGAGQAASNAEMQNQITQKGYDLGRANYLTALNALGGSVNMLNPNSFASSANGAGANATQATKVANDSSWGSILGSIAGGAVSSFAGGLGGGVGKMLGGGGSDEGDEG